MYMKYNIKITVVRVIVPRSPYESDTVSATTAMPRGTFAPPAVQRINHSAIYHRAALAVDFTEGTRIVL
jgi:hypothetical protein